MLNEDNMVADLAKFKRKSFPRNNPSDTMDCPPFFKVMADAYGGQNSLGGPSLLKELLGDIYLCVCQQEAQT